MVVVRGEFLGSVVIRELDVREFRGIRRLVKPLELGVFNVLIGRNNVGKTAILEALYLLAMPYETYMLPPYDKKVLELIAKSHGGLPSLIYGYAGTAVVKYGLGGEVKTSLRGVGSVSVRDVRIRISRDGDIKVLLNNVVVTDSNYAEFLRSMGAHITSDVAALYIPNSSWAYDKLHYYVMKDEVLSWIEKRGLHRKVIKDLIVPTIYDRFTEVTIKRDELCVRKEVSEDVGPLYINVDSLGEGVKRVLLTYLVVEYLRPKILLWDDLEVAVHPSLLESTIGWLASSSRQVVVSTHSIDVLHALTTVRPRDCRVIVLRKSSEDFVDYRVLPIDEVEELMDSGVDVRKIIDELEL